MTNQTAFKILVEDIQPGNPRENTIIVDLGITSFPHGDHPNFRTLYLCEESRVIEFIQNS